MVVNCLSYLALTLWALGYPDQALNRGNEAVALGPRLSHPHSLAFAEGLFGLSREYIGGKHNADQEIAERLVALSAEHGFATVGGLGKMQFRLGDGPTDMTKRELR